MRSGVRFRRCLCTNVNKEIPAVCEQQPAFVKKSRPDGNLLVAFGAARMLPKSSP